MTIITTRTLPQSKLPGPLGVGMKGQFKSAPDTLVKSLGGQIPRHARCIEEIISVSSRKLMLQMTRPLLFRGC